jgi:hypothetical protein
VSIDSLIVGPQAQVRLYRSSEPDLMVVGLTSDQRVVDLSSLRLGDDVDSLQISCPPPGI